MKIHLRKCVRKASARLEVAIREQAARRPQRECVMKWLRVLSPLVRVPLALPKGAHYYLPSMPRPNSKSEAVVNELCASGLPRDIIWSHGYQDTPKVRRVLRFLFRLPAALWLLSSVKRRAPRLGLTELEIVVGHVTFRRLLRRHPDVVPIIISDTSGDLHMLWSAAVAEGLRVLYWQDDYHHLQQPSYPVTYAAVLNQGGYEAVRQGSPEALVFRRPSVSPKPMRTIPKNPRVGVATNAFFVASDEQRALLGGIREALEVGVLELRLHPNSKLSSRDFPESWIKLAPTEETIEQFAARLDLVVVGNSAVQLKLACEGVPVLHTSGLDPHGFDLYGYCENGFSFGTEDAWSITVEQVSRHYQNADLVARVRDYVSVREDADAMPLAALAQSGGTTACGSTSVPGHRREA